ncbi:hypothetical protein QQ045_024607 [Rhodiola kirilowii]
MRKLSSTILCTAVLLLFIFTSTPCVKSDADLSTDVADLCGGHQTTSSSCQIRCFRADPVCGANGVTYWCGCPEAACEGVRVVKRGYCEVGNGGSSGQALLLVHIVWLIVLGISVLFGFI